jgi:UDP-N-acetylglucosamine diphosphorylase/glucosamine-1-phosphate N-acetyltransferase
MPLKICFYEDNAFSRFSPLTYMRPVYTLRAGIVPLYKRTRRYFPDADVCFTAREQISPLLAESYKDIPVNIIKKSDDGVLFLNGRLRDYGDLPQLVQQAEKSVGFRVGDELAAVLFKPGLIRSVPSVATQREYQGIFHSEIEDIAFSATSATLYDYCWQIMGDIEREIVSDVSFLRDKLPDSSHAVVHDGAFLVKPSEVFLGYGVEVSPGAVLDASAGPICIADNCKIEPHAAIYGPTYIGPNCVVVAGKITASSIGHTCRVGGEVEESIFHCYVNKYHAGFIGHSYVGPWVNFGAMTTNSDLKNNYSTIRSSVGGEMIDTGSIKVGSFIGDHTKFGIGTLLNTGINIGLSCNLFGGTLIVDKEVLSFSWGSGAPYDRYDIEKAIDTAKKSTARRDHMLSEREVDLMRQLFNGQTDSAGIITF